MMKWYIVKTKVGTEKTVIADIEARLEGSGSMNEIAHHIGEMHYPPHMKGYIFIEAEEQHFLEAVLGIIGGPHILRVSNVNKVIGEESAENVNQHLQPRKATDKLEVGMIVSLLKGAWKGYEGRIMNLDESADTLTIELWGETIPIPVHDVDASQVRWVGTA